MITSAESISDVEYRRKIDRERKRLERRKNSPYAERVRAKKRSPEYKARRQELRQRPEEKAKAAAYASAYRQRPEAKAKNAARNAVNRALANGTLVRPDRCERCGCADTKLRGGRTALRADHYAGYDQPLTVRFVCVRCDGEQERERGNTTLCRWKVDAGGAS